jgi:hypothetical protein
VFWNGGSDIKDLQLQTHDDIKQYTTQNSVTIVSTFGHGILTIGLPIQLKTPPGVNLMTIAPPNFPLPGMSPMTGMVEADNIRFTFTFNIKINLANTLIKVNANTPLVGLLPVPRYFCDSFELKNANDIFNKDVVEDEMNTVFEHGQRRIIDNLNNGSGDKIYYTGKDIRGNKFKDHQLPKKNNNKA